MRSLTKKRGSCAPLRWRIDSPADDPVCSEDVGAKHILNRPGLTIPTRVIILTAFYFIGGLIGKAGAFMGGDLALVWPPSGIALAAILLFGYRFLPGVALGAILFAFMNGKPLGFFTMGTAIGNSVGAMVCAYLLDRFVQFQNRLDRVR